MFLLAIDTTTSRGSVALLQDEEVRGEVRFVEEGGHSRTLFPAVETVLRLAARPPADVDAYAVAVGPGSFTGVRIGISTVQGLALGSGRPVLGITSLEALAARLIGTSEALVAVMDAYRDQVFVAAYDPELRPTRAPEAVAPDGPWLDELPPRPALLGDGARRYRDAMHARRPDAVFPERSLFLAGTLGRLAAPRLARGEGIDAAALRPSYLRSPDIRLPKPHSAGPGR